MGRTLGKPRNRRMMRKPTPSWGARELGKDWLREVAETRLTNQTDVACCICGRLIPAGKGSTYVKRYSDWLSGIHGTFQFPDWNCGNTACAEIHFSVWTNLEFKRGA